MNMGKIKDQVEMVRACIDLIEANTKAIEKCLKTIDIVTEGRWDARSLTAVTLDRIMKESFNDRHNQ